MKFISRKIRKNVTTSIFHIMVQGINKEYIFNQEIYIKKYLKFLKENQKQTNLKIIAYCIMTNQNLCKKLIVVMQGITIIWKKELDTYLEIDLRAKQ